MSAICLKQVSPAPVQRFIKASTVLLATLAVLLGSPARMWAAIQASPSLHVLVFNPGQIQGNTQKLTASFAVSGYSGSFTPTAVMHYGHDYSLGAVTCTPSGGSETCSVDVTFLPTLPGGRKDAIFMMSGATRIGTLLVYGVGQGPLSAVEPGVVSDATQLPSSNYYYESTIDENGIVYATTNMANTLYRIDKNGTATTITLNGPIADYMVNTLAIDGAGILYLGGFSSSVITYDTVLETMGAIPVPWTVNTNDWQETITIDGVGDLFSIESAPNNGIIEELKADGIATATTLNPELLQPDQLTTDSAGNVFVGGYYTNELTTGGVQTQINTLGSFEGVAVDASETVYVTRYHGTNNNRGVAELSPSNYSTANGFLDTTDTTGDPLGLGLGSDGTLAVGVYQDMDIVDRSQGSIEFDNATTGATTSQTADIRNIGNQSLTLADVSIAGAGYSLTTGSGYCAANTVLAPAESCNIMVSFTSTHAGTLPGTVTIVSDSLAATTTQTIALTGKVSGAYLVASSVPVHFGSQQAGTSSSAQTVTLTNSGLDYGAHVISIASSNPVFTVGAGNCETQAVPLNGNCQMTVTFSPTAAASYSANITLTYNNAGTSTPSVTTVFGVTGTGTTQYSTTTSLASSVNPSISGQLVTFTAKVVASAGPIPTGTVTFTHLGVVLGTASLNASGVATLAYSALAPGTSHISAVYSGSATDGVSTSPLVAQVVVPSTTTSLASSVNPSVSGQSVTFTAKVVASAGPIPTGTVTFTHLGVVLGTASLNASGVATLAYSALAPGTSHISAVYSGSATDGASTSPLVAQVVVPSTTTSLASSVNPSISGQLVTFTAKVVASAGPIPTGTVTFTHLGVVLGTASLNASGVATLAYSALAPGTSHISAVYSGSATDGVSTSPLVAQVVVPSTTTSLASSVNPSVSGQSVTFTAKVVASAGPIPTGTVTFTHLGVVLGTASLNASGVATLAYSALAPGTSHISAVYSGSATDGASTSPLVAQVVNP